MANTVSGNKINRFYTQNGLNVFVQYGRITDTEAEALINAVDTELKPMDSNAKLIRRIGGSEMLKERRGSTRGKVGKIIETPKRGTLGCEVVLHAIVKKWSDYEQATDANKAFYLVYRNCLRRASDMGLSSIALSVFGAGGKDSDTYLDNVLQCIYLAIVDFNAEPSNFLKTIYIVMKKDDTILKLSKLFEDDANTFCSSAMQIPPNNGLNLIGNGVSTSHRLNGSVDGKSATTVKTDPDGACSVKEKCIKVKQPSKETISEPKLNVNKLKDYRGNIKKVSSNSHPRNNFAKGSNGNASAAHSTMLSNGNGLVEICAICLGEIEDPERLAVCGHVFCRLCIQQSFRVHKPACPTCGYIYYELTGDQPKNGRMSDHIESRNLPGHEEDSHGTIVINYTFPDGLQEECHPKPNTFLKGIRRIAYLPNNKEGEEVLGLLKRAFKARLLFTVGTSNTTGRQNVITWNDVHHKTKVFGGPQCFGYPDPGYLKRVKEELALKGIVP